MTNPNFSLCFIQDIKIRAKIKYQIRSKVRGKLVPIYLYYQDSNNHFRIKTDFKVKQENWNATKEIIKPEYFDENNFSIEERNSLEQSLNDWKRKVEREIVILYISTHTFRINSK